MSKEHLFTQEETRFHPSTPSPEAKSSESIWRIDLILKRFSQGELAHPQNALWTDFQALTHEELLAQKTMRWSRELRENSTVGGGYDDPLQRMTQNYVSYLGRENGDISRAILENLILQQTENIATQTANVPGTFMVWISPPGPIEQGYQGVSSEQNWDEAERFPSKIYIMWSQGVEMKTVQLTGWPNVSQLISFWEKMNGQPLPRTTKENILLELIAHLTITENFSGTPQEFVTQISHDFFTTQKEWRHAVEMPQVNLDFFDQEMAKGWQRLYWPELQKLLSTIPLNLSNQDSYWSSLEYQNTVQELDLLFAYYYRSLSLLAKSGAKAQAVDWKKIKKAYHFDSEVRLYGKKTTPAAVKLHQKDISTLLDLTNRAVSVTQCGVLAPFTAPMSMANAMSGMNTAGNINLSIGGGEQNNTYLEKVHSLEYQTKLAEYRRIQEGSYQHVALSVNGKVVHYMVPASFLEGKGCFVITADGKEVAMGPCDIPLNTLFDDPSENLVYQMTPIQFAEHTRQLYNYLFMSDLEKATDGIEKNATLSQTEKQRAKRLLTQLKRLLFKPTIGLSDFVSGITPLAENAGTYLPGQLTQALRNSRHPSRFLEQLVFSKSVLLDSPAL